MSQLPDHDPIPGDARSCDAIEHVIVPRARDIGGFEVRRALPSAAKQMVGPFIFFDQMGPAEFLLGTGMDVRPHPHIGLATVTYLFQGEIWHRDSLGTGSVIRPGDVQKMSAGTGIRHSEFNHSRTDPVHFLQIWVVPSRMGVAPRYEQINVPREAKLGKLVLVATSEEREGKIRLHQDANMYVTLLDSAAQRVEHVAAMIFVAVARPVEIAERAFPREFVEPGRRHGRQMRIRQVGERKGCHRAHPVRGAGLVVRCTVTCVISFVNMLCIRKPDTPAQGSNADFIGF